MSCVFDSSTVSMMLSLLARSEEPVSVTSTMASASTGGFTSVAPQLNSTLALTPLRRQIALGGGDQFGGDDLALRSFTVWNGDASGTASTQRTLPKLCLA